MVVAAIDWVVQHRNSGGLNIRVLNLSFGTDGRQDYRVDPLTYAAEVAEFGVKANLVDPGVVRLMQSGWAYRFKDLPDGRRQIVGFFIPGDFCDLNVYILQQMDYSIGTLIAFIALVALVNGLFGYVNGYAPWFPASLNVLLGWIFSPVAWAASKVTNWRAIGSRRSRPNWTPNQERIASL